MIDILYYAVALILLGGILVGLVRSLAGPTTRDRMLALLLLGTTGAALLIVLAQLTGEAALRDAALFVVVLASIVVVVRVRAEKDRG